jgi:hypothetical protein
MRTVWRAAVVTVMIAATVGIPVAADACEIACEATLAAVSASDPICSPSAPSKEMTSVPAACGHDHSGAIAPATSSAPEVRASAPADAPSVHAIAHSQAATVSRRIPLAMIRPPDTAARELSVRLRV